MKYTTKIQKAIKFAAKTHQVYQDQKRKGKLIPYITHPLTAGLILSLAGAKEDVIVAGILHDTIEDSTKEKKVTPKMVEERFGKNVTKLVMSVTEKKEYSNGKEIPWNIRKDEALEHIKKFSQNSVLVKSGDVLSNGTELIDDYAREGEKIFERFNVGKDKTLNQYQRVIPALLKRWPKNPLAGDLKFLAKEIEKIN